MRRRFRRGPGVRRRTVAWVPGVTTFDQAGNASSRLITLTAFVAPAAGTFATAIALTDDADLSMHGGEDAVLTRIRGKLFFSDGRVNAGAGLAANSFQLRVGVVQTDISPSLAVTPLDLTTSAGLGNDNILWLEDVIVPSTDTSGVGTAMDNIGWDGRHLLVDVKAKRKLQSDRQIVIWFQGVPPAGAIGMDFRLRGGLRSLLMRSR